MKLCKPTPKYLIIITSKVELLNNVARILGVGYDFHILGLLARPVWYRDTAECGQAQELGRHTQVSQGEAQDWRITDDL